MGREQERQEGREVKLRVKQRVHMNSIFSFAADQRCWSVVSPGAWGKVSILAAENLVAGQEDQEERAQPMQAPRCFCRTVASSWK